jgi:uncharacterized protein (DUF1499 family)
VAAVLFVVGPLIAHFGIVPPIAGFATFALGGLLAIGCDVAGTIAIVRGGVRNGALAAAIAAVPAILLIAGAVAGRQYPRINDITTDLSDPPAFVAATTLPENEGRDLGYPETFKDVVRGAYPDLEPLRVAAPAPVVFDRVLAAAESQPTWTVTSVDRSRLAAEAVATSWLFRFQDDIALRVRPDGDGAVVDMRSKSRVGQGDVGANATRIRDFLAKLPRS